MELNAVPEVASVVQKSETLPKDRWLQLAAVSDIVGCGKSWIYDAIRTKDFPKPVQLSKRCVRWSERAVLHWVFKRGSA